MSIIKTFESWGEREIILTHKNDQSLVIRLSVVNSKIVSINHLRKIGNKEVDISPVIRFPFSVGQTLSRNIEVWACNNNFYIDGKNTCPEKKIFGVRVSDVPKGHEWRHIFPNKFR